MFVVLCSLKIKLCISRLNIMQQVASIISFYKPLILWSFLINIVIVMVNPLVWAAFTTKLLLTVYLYFHSKETNVKRKLKLYKKLGVSSLKLFTFTFLIDIFLSIFFIEILQEYI